MKIKTIAIIVSLLFALLLTACGGSQSAPAPLPQCPVGYTLDGDGEDAWECEPDTNQNGVGDDDEGIFDAPQDEQEAEESAEVEENDNDRPRRRSRGRRG